MASQYLRVACKPLTRSLLRRSFGSTRNYATVPNNRFLSVSEEIREAIHAKKPVVALESTIYTHGFPSPENKRLALDLENIVRSNGAIPATIGVIDSKAIVGMTNDQIARLCDEAGGPSVLKLSRRDIAYACGLGLTNTRLHGGTTIAGTMILANLAGIKVFATGGLGGVHRGAESSMDISADLTELGRTPVAVIASGCKGFLDIPRTLEYLETQGVAVATFRDGRSSHKVDFPAFWSRDSGSTSPMAVDGAREAAGMIHAQSSLSINSGLLFANPISANEEIPKAEMQEVIAQALRAADEGGFAGRDNTPFVLNKIKELTGGKSIKPNWALIASNAKMGTEIAKELALLEGGDRNGTMKSFHPVINASSDQIAADRRDTDTKAGSVDVSSSSNSSLASQTLKSPEIVVAGSLAIDYSCDYNLPSSGTPGSSNASQPKLHTSNPCIIRPTLGGVGHNIAKAAHYMGADVRLSAPVGNDLPGHAALEQLKAEGMRLDGIHQVKNDPARPEKTARTAQYIALNDAKKDLFIAMADMSLIEEESSNLDPLQGAEQGKTKWLVVDGNLTPEAIQSLFQQAKRLRLSTAFEPVSVAKSIRVLSTQASSASKPVAKADPLPVFPNHIVDLITPNNYELAALHTHARDTGMTERKDWWAVIDALGIPSTGARNRFTSMTNAELTDQGIPQQMIQLLPFIPCIITKLGSKGVLLARLLPKGDKRLHSADSTRYILSRNLDDTDQANSVGGVYMRLFQPAEQVSDDQIVSVNGVGDTFLGALLASAVKTGKGVEELVDLAQQAAVLTLKSPQSVSPELQRLRKW